MKLLLECQELDHATPHASTSTAAIHLRAAAAIRRGERPLWPTDNQGIPFERMESFWVLKQQMWTHDADCRPAAQAAQLQLEDIFASLPAVAPHPLHCRGCGRPAASSIWSDGTYTLA